MIHISRNEACKTFYGQRFDEMKEVNKKGWMPKFRAKIGKENTNILQRKRYHDGDKDTRKQYYEENRESLSKASRERAQSKRNDSNCNKAAFERDTEFGPEFICICCHGAYFEKDVYELTEKRRNAIKQDVLKKWCEENDNFQFY